MEKVVSLMMDLSINDETARGAFVVEKLPTVKDNLPLKVLELSEKSTWFATYRATLEFLGTKLGDNPYAEDVKEVLSACWKRSEGTEEDRVAQALDGWFRLVRLRAEFFGFQDDLQKIHEKAPWCTQFCFSCGNMSTKHCGQCKKVKYCDQACQRQDWARHKRVCPKKSLNIS